MPQEEGKGRRRGEERGQEKEDNHKIQTKLAVNVTRIEVFKGGAK